jgi:predicted Zn-dependent protease
MQRLAALVLVTGCWHAGGTPLPPLPRATYAHYLAGKLAAYGGDPATAARELAAAAAAAPDQPMIVVDEARALVKAQQDADARTLLEAARSKWPKHPEVWLASGELSERTSPIDAMHSYDRAIELARDDERAYLGLARIQLVQHDAAGAEHTLRDLVAHVPSSVEGRFRLAQRLLERGDRAHAIPELQRVLERDPDQIDARLELARALRADGKLSDAVAQTRSAFDRAGQPMDVAEELFWLLCEVDDLQGAQDLLTLLDDDRSDTEALLVVARLALGLGELDHGAAIAKRLVDADDDAAALVKLEVDFARRDFPALDRDAAAIAASSPQAHAAQHVVAEAAFYRGDPARAVSVLEAIPGSQDAELVVSRARAKALTGDPRGALALIEARVHAQPDDVAALNLTGYLLADTNTRLADAERYLQRARLLAPGDPAVLDSWGWLLLAEGRTQDAMLALAHATRIAPLEPEILLHLAAAQLAARAPSAAVVATLDRAAALHPSVEVERKIAAVRGKLGTS